MRPQPLAEGATLLDSSVYEQARQTRDARYDGRFFVGVVTTGIYCRPVCPVRVPKQENVRLYRSAASAASAGFRPCLRCRPESSPGTPAWSSGSWKVTRALELIERGFLDEATLAALAAQLAIGERQLGRLFQEHVGAAPSEVAQTRRLHFAKKLIDETTLPLTEVCFAAGFGSVRRFNAVVKDTYNKSPRELRLASSRSALSASRSDSSANSVTNSVNTAGQRSAGVPITLKLSYRPPFDWRALLAFLAYRAIPGVESVGEQSYARSFRLFAETESVQLARDYQHEPVARGHFIAHFCPASPFVTLTVWIDNTAALQRVVERVRAIFDLRADSAAIDAALAKDPQLAPLVSAFAGTRVPGCWSGFEVAVRAILGQQVTVKAASTLVARVAQRHGTSYDCDTPGIDYFFPEPARLARASLDGLGIVQARVQAITEVAQRVVSGSIKLTPSASLTDFVKSFCEIKGIGEWTAHYVAMRALSDPNAFPHSDLILLRAAAGEGAALKPKQLLQRAAAWQPWRAYTVLLLWRSYADKQNRTPTALKK